MSDDPVEVLAPNNMGTMFANYGVGELVMNRGLGVAEAQNTNQRAMTQRAESANPQQQRDRMRIAKAREFGMKKTEVGF